MLGMTPVQIMLVAMLSLLALIALVIVATFVRFFGLWLQCTLSNAPIAFMQLVGMKLRRVDPKTIAINRIRAQKAGIGVTTAQLETHYLAGGRVSDVVVATIMDHRVSGENRFEQWCTVDLAGYDVRDAAEKAINGKLDMDSFSIEAIRAAGVQRRYDR